MWFWWISLDVHPPCISEIHRNCVKLIQRIIERNKKTLWTFWWIFLRLKAKHRSLETHNIICSEPCDFSNGSCLLFDYSYRHMVYHGFYLMLMYLIRVFLLILYPSLQALVAMPHRCNKVMEVLNKMHFFCSYSLLYYFPYFWSFLCLHLCLSLFSWRWRSPSSSTRSYPR